MRLCAIALAACLISCSPPPPPTQQQPPPPQDLTQSIARLNTLNAEARAALARNDRDTAAKKIAESEPLAAQVLAPSRPTLDAMLAAADRDQLYGDMLFANRHWGFARQMYAKNAARWRAWQPATPETGRRLAEARKQLAACDREIERQ